MAIEGADSSDDAGESAGGAPQQSLPAGAFALSAGPREVLAGMAQDCAPRG